MKFTAPAAELAAAVQYAARWLDTKPANQADAGDLGNRAGMVARSRSAEEDGVTAVTTHDPIAHERFRTIVADAIDKPGMDAPWYEAEPVANRFPTAYFERTVNEHGHAVRRLHVVGEWETDPEPPKFHPVERGDVVRYADREFGEHDDWVVISVPFKALDPRESSIWIARPEWGKGRFVPTSAREVRIMRRSVTR